ncbi:uncharacterized protein LOC144632560 [Oculina patagonica]
MSDQAPDKKYRIWSLTSQKYLALKEDGASNPTVDCTGTEELQSTEFTRTQNTTTAKPSEVSWHYVYRAKNGTKYALHVNEKQTPATISFQPFTGQSSASLAAFVPTHFCMASPGLFKALKVANSQNCIASNKDGQLSLQSFKTDDPHPGTIFVITEID